MPLRLAFDLDGVLADLDLAFRQVAAELFGERPAAAPVAQPVSFDPAGFGRDDQARDRGALNQAAASELPAPSLGLSPRQWEQVWRRIQDTDNFWEGLREIESGSVGTLAAVAKKLRWEVIFLTQRPSTAGETAQVQSQRWLETHGFALPSVFVVAGSRAKIASALQLDLVVDDHHEHCLDIVTESKARALLVWRGGPSIVPQAARRLGIGVVDSVTSCLDILQEVDSIVSSPPTVLERLKRKLRL